MIRFLAWLAVAAAITFIGTLALYAVADAIIYSNSSRVAAIDVQTGG
jgi:hypothetical protein